MIGTTKSRAQRVQEAEELVGRLKDESPELVSVLVTLLEVVRFDGSRIGALETRARGQAPP